MWPFAVEFSDEVIELRLLLQDIGGGRPRRLLLEREMHPFMAAVLLGVARANAFYRDAETQPPHREPGELKQPVR